MIRPTHFAAAYLALVAAGLLWIVGCERTPDRIEVADTKVELVDGAHPRLRAHSAEFERRIYEVTEGVHVAVGYGLANSILLVGDGGVVIVDTMESTESASAVMADFRKISQAPIAALIYTHNHADHVFGGRGFVPEGEVDVYAHETTSDYIDRLIGVVRPVISTRSGRMFGSVLPAEGPDAVVNAGIGPRLALGPDSGTPSLIRPNKTFRDRMQLEIAGIRIELVHAPGETNDQLFVWLPEKRVLLPGDNIYRAFPNLYTIRGTPYRDVLDWVASLDAMRALRPEHLVPSHTRPLSGEVEVQSVLTAYRDAIQYVHDQTVRGMNAGLTPDELVGVVALPPHLADHPYLEEFYGTVEWSVRSVYDGYMGWFDGDAATLSPEPPDVRSRRLVELAGGAEAMRGAARAALDAGDHAWAAELARHAMRADPDDGEARRLVAAAYRALGRRSKSPNGRNYYLTQAGEVEGTIGATAPQINESVLPLIHEIPIDRFLAAMPSSLDPSLAGDVTMTVGFHFTDVDEHYTLALRRGVLEMQPGAPTAQDVGIVVDSQTWREVVTGFRSPAVAFASGDVEIEGSALDLVRFLSYFSRS
ncbi:MAG: MBL fold metallo-hydrolase [Deltaproteobacteria bacterium]|nr:MBL fold metallo-hydrolase [Deltaproteobacteria bacterium]